MFSLIGHDSTACVFSSSAFQPHPQRKFLRTMRIESL